MSEAGKWLMIQVQWDTGAMSSLGSWQVPEGDAGHTYLPDSKCAPLGWQVLACFMGEGHVRNMRIIALEDPHGETGVPEEWAVNYQSALTAAQQENAELRKQLAIPEHSEQMFDRLLDRIVDADGKLNRIREHWASIAESDNDTDTSAEELALQLCLAEIFDATQPQPSDGGKEQ